MTRVIHGLFPNESAALAVIADLEASGIDRSDISLIANQVPRANDPNHIHVRDAVIDVAPDEALPGPGTAAAVGAASGATVGILAAVGAIVLPGIGPILAAGWLFSTLAGAAAGAATGGLVGLLTETGVGGADATFYNDGIGRGLALVTVRADENGIAISEGVMERHGRIHPPTAGTNQSSSYVGGHVEAA